MYLFNGSGELPMGTEIGKLRYFFLAPSLRKWGNNNHKNTKYDANIFNKKNHHVRATAESGNHAVLFTGCT